MPTDITTKASGTFVTARKSSKSNVYNITTLLKDKLLMPYMFEGHCALLLINITKETFTLLDPYETECDRERVFVAFKTYIALQFK